MRTVDDEALDRLGGNRAKQSLQRSAAQCGAVRCSAKAATDRSTDAARCVTVSDRRSMATVWKMLSKGAGGDANASVASESERKNAQSTQRVRKEYADRQAEHSALSAPSIKELAQNGFHPHRPKQTRLRFPLVYWRIDLRRDDMST